MGNKYDGTPIFKVVNTIVNIKMYQITKELFISAAIWLVTLEHNSTIPY